MPYPVDSGRAAYQLRPKMSPSPPSRNWPGVAVLSVEDAITTQLRVAFREQDIQHKNFANAARLAYFARRIVFTLVVVHAQAIDTPYGQLLDVLRSCGVRRVVLVGPRLEDAQYMLALEAGFDEVWPEALPQTTLPVLVRKAWQTARQTPPVDAEWVLTLGDLLLAAESYCCWVEGRKVYLGRTGFSVLKCLALSYPDIASRGKLSMATREEDVAGLCEGSRAMDVAVSRLRKKLHEAGSTSVRIRSVSGLGYQLCKGV